MKNIKQSILVGVTLTVSLSVLTGCSFFGKVGKSVRNATNVEDKNKIAVNEKLVIPPSLKTPAPNTKVAAQAQKSKANVRTVPSKNYYVVVGTYPDQDQAVETFVRLSSIGLPGATMESRSARNGKLLHMVRLGPYQKQEDIDRVKDRLTSDGLSQFKVVEN